MRFIRRGYPPSTPWSGLIVYAARPRRPRAGGATGSVRDKSVWFLTLSSIPHRCPAVSIDEDLISPWRIVRGGHKTYKIQNGILHWKQHARRHVSVMRPVHVQLGRTCKIELKTICLVSHKTRAWHIFHSFNIVRTIRRVHVLRVYKT